MRFLIDTHTFLWFIGGDPAMSARSRALVEDLGNELLLSIASLWEIAIKVAQGKLNIGGRFEDVMPQRLQENEIGVLSVNLAHLAVVSELPHHHRDPFDRLTIAQRLVERLPIISVDPAFDAYDVVRVW